MASFTWFNLDFTPKIRKIDTMDIEIMAISGLARSGKDTLCRMLPPHMQIVRYAFADALKEELKEFVLKQFNIDTFTEDKKEKNIIRPLLIAYANAKRAQTNGAYWHNLLLLKIKEDYAKGLLNNKIVCITDLRFAETNDDEVQFVRKMGGFIVHLSKFRAEVVRDKLIKVFDEPPNDFEAINDPKIKQLADYRLEWPDYLSFGKDENYLKPFINDFVHWYEENRQK